MNLNELQRSILQCATVKEWDDYLATVLNDIRSLFYGRTRSELFANHGHLMYEDTILAIATSPVGQALASGGECPKNILALLIFFMSLFERVRLYGAIFVVAGLLPAGSLRNRAEAIFQYKDITAADADYEQRFDTILGLLQLAWENGDDFSCQQCVDILQEYFLDAVIETKAAGFDISTAMKALFQNPDSLCKYSILSVPQVQQTANLLCINMERTRASIRSRIIESLHAEACRLAPDALLARPIEDSIGEESHSIQNNLVLPHFIDAQILSMGGRHEIQRGEARTNYDADSERNRIYLGTFFPRTVIESWNIFSELLSMPAIDGAFSQKEAIRILDIGSGTGGVIVGFLLALRDWGRCSVPIDITSIDFNEDALEKQKVIIEAIGTNFPFAINCERRQVQLPFDLEGYVTSLSSIASTEGPRHDVITCWKCLCEFYNTHFAQSQGIVRHTLDLVSHMLVPYGLGVLADITTRDNNYEYFAMTLNREANEYERQPNAKTRTVLPIPCAKASVSCSAKRCFTQRRFILNHALASNETSKIAYRVLAPVDFAKSITSDYRHHSAFRVNAARPLDACCNGTKREFAGVLPCGYTGF